MLNPVLYFKIFFSYMFNNATYTLELQGSGAAPAAGSLAPPLHPNLVFQGPGAASAAGSLALFYTLT